jgi:uncharacterized protein GlcG (DUF336 family)
VARVDYFDDPDAPAINSVVPSVTVAVLDDQGRLLLIHKIDNGPTVAVAVGSKTYTLAS